MKDENLTYGFEHWRELRSLGKAIEASMVEVPAGIVTIGEKDFHVGTFKISKLLVTEKCWGRVMGDGNRISRKPVTDVAFTSIYDFLQRLNVSQKTPGRLSIPTEAQLLLAQESFIRPNKGYKEICLTQYKKPHDMGEHHFFGNLPKEEPYELVVRQFDKRESLPYNNPATGTGFRLVLVDYYMTRRQVSTAIVNALELSEYSSVYKRDGVGCLIYFEYSGNVAMVSQPDAQKACMMIYPDQVKDGTIVVSTDIVRLPQDMDSNSIMERLIKLNAENKGSGIRYDAPWLYHASEGMNRVLYVIKEFRPLSEVHVMAVLPEIIKEVMAKTGGFNILFNNAI